ncbi:collagen alpha-1(I) chain-like isoform X6 [Pseudopipra pipra]|uniref:collagen alpha-1(I) chain-like isoform X6 n=1 Tax=Pseudopipra pipra TaxID=415032 RepID=UPI003138E1E7
MELSGAGSPPRALCCRLGAATELQDGVFQGQKCSQGHTGAQLSRSPGPARFCSWHACPAPQGSCLPARGAARPARPAWTPAPRGFLANSQGFETLGNSFLLQPWTLGSSWSLRDPGQGNTGTPPGVGVLGTSSSTNRDTLPNTVLAGSGMAELEGHSAGCPRGDSSPVPWEQEQSWAPLLGSSPGDRSSSSSICTEDFAARFQEGMVLPEEEEDELTGIVPAEGADPGQDESSFPTGRSLDVQRQLGTDPGRKLWEDRSPSLMRRGSLESLGARISQLSQSHVLGGAWGEPCPAPSAQPALGQGDPLQGGPGSREALLAFALPGHPLRTPGISAGRSRAGARTGSASLPGASSARTRGHPSSKALGQRLQEPPALRGQSRGNVTLAVDDTEREGAGSRSRAPCSDHRCGGTAGVTAEEPGGDTRAGIWCQDSEWRGQSQGWPGTAATHLGQLAQEPHGPGEDVSAGGGSLCRLPGAAGEGGKENVGFARRETGATEEAPGAGAKQPLPPAAEAGNAAAAPQAAPEGEGGHPSAAPEDLGAGKRWQERPAGASPGTPTGAGGAGAGWAPPGHGDLLSEPVPTPAPPQQCPGTGPLPGGGRLVPPVPQPRAPHPAGAPGAHPAAPPGLAEGGGSPGTCWTEEEGAAAGEDTARGEPECPGGELGSTAREEVQRQPGDSPCATTSAQGWIQTRRSCRAPLRIMPRTDLPGGNGPATGLGHRGLCLTWRPRAGPTTTSNLCHGISDTRVVR